MSVGKTFIRGFGTDFFSGGVNGDAGQTNRFVRGNR